MCTKKEEVFLDKQIIQLGVLGEVLGHSQSPKISEAISKEMQVETNFQLFEVPQDEMDGVMEYLDKFNLTGLSVTIPYKQIMMGKVDVLSKEVQAIGALNCIHFKDGKSYGYNTDCIGFSKMLEKNDVLVANKEVVVLGAGGACCGIVYALHEDGAKKITVVGRRKEQLAKMKERFPYIETCLFDEIEGGDILVNTTSVGMYPNIEASIVQKEVIERFNVLVDIVYNPLMTRFLQLGEEAKKQVVTGLTMLEEQAIAAHKIWLAK